MRKRHLAAQGDYGVNIRRFDFLMHVIFHIFIFTQKTDALNESKGGFSPPFVFFTSYALSFVRERLVRLGVLVLVGFIHFVNVVIIAVLFGVAAYDRRCLIIVDNDAQYVDFGKLQRL